MSGPQYIDDEIRIFLRAEYIACYADKPPHPQSERQQLEQLRRPFRIDGFRYDAGFLARNNPFLGSGRRFPVEASHNVGNFRLIAFADQVHQDQVADIVPAFQSRHAACYGIHRPVKLFHVPLLVHLVHELLVLFGKLCS